MRSVAGAIEDDSDDGKAASPKRIRDNKGTSLEDISKSKERSPSIAGGLETDPNTGYLT